MDNNLIIIFTDAPCKFLWCLLQSILRCLRSDILLHSVSCNKQASFFLSIVPINEAVIWTDFPLSAWFCNSCANPRPEFGAGVFYFVFGSLPNPVPVVCLVWHIPRCRNLAPLAPVSLVNWLEHECGLVGIWLAAHLIVNVHRCFCNCVLSFLLNNHIGFYID